MPYLLYDADCRFCRWSAGLVLAWDRRQRLRPVAIQSARGARLLTDLDAKGRLDSWHLVGEAGTRASAGAAGPALLRLLPGGRPLAAALERFPRPTERAYRWIADHRSGFGRLIPSGRIEAADARIERRS